MNELSEKRGLSVRHLDFWLLLGLLAWISMLSDITLMGKEIISTWCWLLVSHAPALVFAWRKERLSQQLTRRQYGLHWLLYYGILLPVIIVYCVIYKPGGLAPQQYVTAAIFTVLLELLLSANAWYRQRMQHAGWMQHISLDRAALISLLLIAVTLSAMAVSSLNNPAYHTKEQLLIGYEFNLFKIIRHFGTFLGFCAQFLFMYLCGYFLYYVNSRILVTKVLKQRGIVIYVLSVFATIALLYPVMGQLLALLPINHLLGGIFPDNPFKLENAAAGLAIIFTTLPIVLALQWTKQNNKVVSLEKEKMRSELDLLKQQLNPHFFFNTLNNLYALSLQQSRQTPESILQLSELMRYVIYKGQEAAVNIREEIKYVEGYMELQQIRLKKPLDLQFTQEISDDAPVIPPMLLIVFVENAFKHGIEPAEDAARLHLHLTCNARQLTFSCENSFEGETTSNTGIGLSNLQKRLALLYPGRHVLKTAVKNHTFKAEMQLDLS